MVIQLASREKIAVNLPSRDQLVPMVLVESEAELSGELEFRGTIYYPFRIGGTGGLEFPERCVQGVLDIRCKPLVIVEGDSDGEEQSLLPVAVYYAPGPEAVPMSSVELVAT